MFKRSRFFLLFVKRMRRPLCLFPTVQMIFDILNASELQRFSYELLSRHIRKKVILNKLFAFWRHRTAFLSTEALTDANMSSNSSMPLVHFIIHSSFWGINRSDGNLGHIAYRNRYLYALRQASNHAYCRSLQQKLYMGEIKARSLPSKLSSLLQYLNQEGYL